MNIAATVTYDFVPHLVVIEVPQDIADRTNEMGMTFDVVPVQLFKVGSIDPEMYKRHRARTE